MDRIFLLGIFQKYCVGDLKTGLIISFFLSCEKSQREVLQKKRDTRGYQGSFIVLAGRTVQSTTKDNEAILF